MSPRGWPRLLGGVALLLGLTGADPAVPETTTRSDTARTAASSSGHTLNALEMRPLKLVDLDGHPRNLADWRGQVILLNFWASWCAPCQYEIREFVRFQDEQGPQGLQIIGVGIDEVRKLANVRRTLGINYPVLVADPARQSGLLKEWGDPSGTIPYTVVIDRDGTVRYTHRGLFDADTFAAFVLPLLHPDKAGPIHRNQASIR